MPKQIDQEALESPNMKILDINNPPTKNIPYEAFPKAVYLHPKDKTQEHRAMIVENATELESAEAKGYKQKPHIPEDAPEDLSGFEMEEKRGPGRPKAS